VAYNELHTRPCSRLDFGGDDPSGFESRDLKPSMCDAPRCVLVSRLGDSLQGVQARGRMPRPEVM
jgi:hypothetical protein